MVQGRTLTLPEVILHFHSHDFHMQNLCQKSLIDAVLTTAQGTMLESHISRDLNWEEAMDISMGLCAGLADCLVKPTIQLERCLCIKSPMG